MYLVITLPWIVWFGYHILDALAHPYGSLHVPADAAPLSWASRIASKSVPTAHGGHLLTSMVLAH